MQLNQQIVARATPRLSLRMAKTPQDLQRIQKLRFHIFGEEMGARLVTQDQGIDSDEYDALCDHLMVIDQLNNKVVGTYRMLPPAAAARMPGLYSEHEFNLERLDNLRPNLIEIGRSCVHRKYRSGAVITLLWAGLAEYARKHSCEYLAGCASVSLADGGNQAVSLYRQLETSHLAPPEWRVFPLLPLPLDRVSDEAASAPMPALIKGYLRAGAFVCGEPAWDPDFNCADFFMLLSMQRLSLRYDRHFNGK